MCLAIPLQVIRMEGVMALCRGPKGNEWVDTLLTGPLQPGQWVLGFLGAAREVIDAGRAAQVAGALSALQSILDGGEGIDAVIDHHFPDLVGREPQLPAYLRSTSINGSEL